jgi:aryl-alcohol dehydrogenase-like predicted oxidoreductase
MTDEALRPVPSQAFSNALSRGAFLRLTAAAGLAACTGAVAAEPLVAKAIPRSPEKETLPCIGLGTAQEFGLRGDTANMNAKTAVMKTLVADGGKVLDTAASYGDAEAISGEIMEKAGLRPQIFIATKLDDVRGKQNGVRSIEDSFKKLRTNTIDLMYVHNMIDADTHLPTLKDYKAQKKIRYIGVTNTYSDQDHLTTWMDDLDFVEFAYSVDFRDAERRLLPMARDKGVAVFVALPFGRGRLLSAMRGRAVPAWAKQELGCTSFAQLALKFLVSHPAVTVAIPGTENPQHMAENLDAGRTPLASEKQREMIAALWA